MQAMAVAALQMFSGAQRAPDYCLSAAGCSNAHGQITFVCRC
jgi:hypothetical protein